MTKFHINKHGVPAPCRAERGKCPLGGESGELNHFNTEKEAEDFIKGEFEKEYGILYSENLAPTKIKTLSDDGLEIEANRLKKLMEDNMDNPVNLDNIVDNYYSVLEEQESRNEIRNGAERSVKVYKKMISKGYDVDLSQVSDVLTESKVVNDKYGDTLPEKEKILKIEENLKNKDSKIGFATIVSIIGENQ